MERAQLDLIDMTNQPYRGFNYIAHFIDHFLKFNILWALVTKTAEEVASGLKMYVFPYVGLPVNFQMDNGLEFKNKTVRELVNDWPGDCKIIHSRPRHPQTNGLVEQSNGTVKTMLCAMMNQIGLDKEESKDWPSLLPRVMFNMNTQRHSATKFSPFHLAFKQLPNLGNQVVEAENAEVLI